jgi:manganese efflux pump family protein
VNLLTIILIAFALSMDAFAVSLCFGTCVKNKTTLSIKAGAFFGIFQAIMPLIGWSVGFFLKETIRQIDHLIVFALLTIIGGRMIFEAIKDKNVKLKFNTNSVYVMLSLSVATSIDAFAVGLSFALLQIHILLAISIIGVVTFFMSYIGVYIGWKLGSALGKKAEIIGGIILICMGAKVLIEHLYNYI